MTVKEAVKYIISESKKDESLLTDTKRFWAYLIDLSSDYRKELNVIKRSLDDPTAVFSSMASINNNDVSAFNFHFNLSLTNQNYLDFINILITDLKSEILNNNSSFNLELKIILNANSINVIPQNSQVTPYIKL